MLRKQTEGQTPMTRPRNDVRERIRTGIEGFDRILGGGFPEGTLNCIEGDIGTGTTTFCVQVVWSRLISEGLAAYLCFDESSDRVVDHFKSFGYDVEFYIHRNQFLLEDGHPLLNSLASANHGGQNGASERKALFKKFLEDYNKKTCALRKQHSSNTLPVVTVVDSFTSATSYIDLKSVYVLAQMIGNSARKHKNLLLLVAHTGAIEANILCACNAAADGIIRIENSLKRGELRRLMRIEKMAFTPTPAQILEYRITSKNGIEVLAGRSSE